MDKTGFAIAAEPGELLYETDTGFWNISVDAEADPDASGGLAQCRHNAGYMGRTWISALPAGQYHFSLRMKLAGPDEAKL